MAQSTFNKVLFSSAVVAGIAVVAPQDADAALGDRTLRQGMSHPDVTELQNALKEKGFFTYGTATGYFGTHTRDAVIAYQKANNLLVDGVAGPQTLSSLTGAAVSAPNNNGNKTADTQPSSKTSLLRVGSRGGSVTALQEDLRKLGFFNQSPTGYYGTVTRDAVRAFQRANNLQADGIAGPATQAALKNGGNRASENDTPSKSKPASSTGSLRLGDRNSQVTDLQNQLRSLGYFNQNATGYYGEVTRSAVREFQKNNGLSADGIAGPQTFAKLSNSPAPVNKNQTVNNNQPAQTNQNASGLVSGLISSAQSAIGVPYAWGGTSMSGFDCSGFIQYIFRQNGVSVPRTASEQWNKGTSVSSPSVGDVVFFETYKAGPSHNGIYIGDNKFIHAGSSRGVEVADMNNSYWKPRYLGAKRLH
ncbi:peptidoglycan-binding protein [Shouchella clausii]|uniref:Cell wall lytic activity endopeptidase n=2 Tax=Shouchella TaxID=2893057 RepID=Q5WBA2_SHOC1|nr:MULTISPECIES: peptidoglycan-binding protein [Shouchella]ALA53201.1 cell wall lytic activity [Shouchella clausii]MCZ1183934.1 peptidase [Shouchella clausii]MDO7284030.1 peptidoglycan-binding protein [Shouchella clausii]MDO7304126.1 peptidoglycan-binding protein [Shouchella clausii]MDP0462323.1 peptidoglycan-binding protein [Shouchella rhizosphaerae]